MNQKLPSPESPWMGLGSYNEACSDYFYGRDREVQALYQSCTIEPLTVLYGRSGLGKTSLLHAGLLPRLKVEGRQGKVIRLRFGLGQDSLVQQVRQAVLGCLSDTENAELLSRPLWQLAHDSETVDRLQWLRPVLIFDQFEEVFSLSLPSSDKGRERPDRRPEVEALILELADLIEGREPAELQASIRADRSFASRLNNPSAIRVIFALRADFLHQIERWKKALPSLMRNRIELLELRGPQALEVVLKPASKGATPLLERDVAHAIVCRVAKCELDTPLDEIEAVPPLLSLICDELNSTRLQAGALLITRKQLDLESERVMEAFFERCFSEMPSGVRVVIEDLLIDNSGRYRESSSDETVIDEMRKLGVDQPRQYLDRLIDGRLLTEELRDGAKRIELTHDTLVRLVNNSRIAREKLEFRALEAEAKEKAAKEHSRVARERTTRWVASLFALLVGLLGIVSYLALEQRDVARRSEQEAQRLNRQAATRALGRAREQNADGDFPSYAGYLIEAIAYLPELPQNEAALALQQLESPALNKVLTHGSSVRIAVFSPDGTRVLTTSRDNTDTAQVWDATSGRAIGSPLRHKYAITSAAFSPDSQTVVTGSDDNTAKVWSATGEASNALLLQHDSSVTSVTFSPDGARILTASSDHTARIWDARTGAEMGPQLLHAGKVTLAAFNSGGDRVVTACDVSAQVWDATSGQRIGSQLTHSGAVSSADFSPNGKWLVTSSMDGTARIWDADSGSAIGPQLKHDRPIVTAKISPDGRHVVTASWDNTARIWDVATGMLLGSPLQHDGWLRSATFSPDGRRLVTASNDDTARIWDAKLGIPVSQPFVHLDRVYSAAFSPDGRQIVTASADGNARIWEASDVSSPGVWLEKAGRVAFAAFSPDSRSVIAADWDHQVQIWQVETGAGIKLPTLLDGRVLGFAFRSEVLRLSISDEVGTVQIWDAERGIAIGRALSHSGIIYSAEFSKDLSHVVTASADGTARIWDAISGDAVAPPLPHDAAVRFAAFSPDGQRVVTASTDRTSRIWNTVTGAQIGPSLFHDAGVRTAAFSPDGLRVVTASDDGAARVWDANRGVVLGAPLQHAAEVLSAAFDPDGKRVVTASYEGVVRIWDVASGTVLGRPLSHDSEIVSVNFSPDGRKLIIVSLDGMARIWDVQTSQMLGEPVLAAELTAISGQRVGDDGQLRWLAGDEWQAMIKQVKTKAEAGETAKDRLISWHLGDRRTRAISPFSRISTRRYIQDQVDFVLEAVQAKSPDVFDFGPELLEGAYNLDPSHPLILLALSVFESHEETKKLWKRLSFQRFENDPHLSVRAAEILLIDGDAENAVRAADNVLKLASATEADKAMAQAVLDRVRLVKH